MPRLLTAIVLLIHSVVSLRVLALHGKGGSGAQFRRVLQPLAERLDDDGTACEFVCPDAPHEGKTWWTIEPIGARSFEAASFGGVSESIALLQEAAAGEPFDAVIGHSQGGMLGAVLVAQRALRYGRSRKVIRAGAPAVFSGAALPKPYQDLFTRILDERPSLPPTLHCVGSADEIIPPEQSKRLLEAFAPTALELSHSGGHVTPLDDASVQRLAAVIRLASVNVAMERRAAESKAARAGPPKTGSVHGVPLKTILSELVDRYGWQRLARAVPVRCFMNEPSIPSSLRFLRKTDWAREKVERIYIEGLGPDRPAQQAPSSATSGAAKRRARREQSRPSR
jgi:uncharacterized protein (DUF2132 family)/pimeloyl-ACP methyl ester carboxylesterase